MAQRVPITVGNLRDHQVGTDDTLTGAPNSTNLLYGDAGGSLLDHSVGGNDALIGGANSRNTLYGDARLALRDHARGGARCAFNRWPRQSVWRCRREHC